MSETTDTSCTECDRVRLEKELEAQESARAFERELEKISRQHANELEKAVKDHELELKKASVTANASLRAGTWTTEGELSKIFHQTIADVAKGGIDRSRDSAKFVQVAASAIAVVYTGVLGLSFSVTANPLPIRGVYAALFLGLAVALATAYLAYLTKPAPPGTYSAGSSLTQLQLNRTGYLTKWVYATVQTRRWAIRASVISLLVGVAFIPAAFVSIERPVDVPDAPSAPQIPAAIAADLSGTSKQLFATQVKTYLEASKARDSAVKTAATAAENAADDERLLNVVATILAGLGLVAVVVGPFIVRGRD